MSYGIEPSSLEITSRRAPLDIEVSLLLGQLLIGDSRMDLAVQLYVDALHGARTHATPGADVEARLGRLLSFADTLPDKELRAGFVQWIVRARELLPLARSLREGRWMPDPRRSVVLLLAQAGGHPAAARSFTMKELRRAATEQKELLAEFHRLCGIERGLPRASAASFASTQPIGVVERAA